MPDDLSGSIRVEGDLPPLAGAVVLLVDTPGTIAVGDVPWGLPADVVVDPSAADPLAGVPPTAPLVVQVRDAHRQDGVRRVLAAVADTRATRPSWSSGAGPAPPRPASRGSAPTAGPCPVPAR